MIVRSLVIVLGLCSDVFLYFCGSERPKQSVGVQQNTQSNHPPSASTNLEAASPYWLLMKVDVAVWS